MRKVFLVIDNKGELPALVRGESEQGEAVVLPKMELRDDELHQMGPFLIESAQDQAIEGKYGAISASRKEFHPGEPVFILRATDPIAASAIEHYAVLCEGAKCNPEHVLAATGHANRIREWQKRNPHLVKERPD